ncbi:MAG: ABC transporter ATP-binding protein [Opitutaceae bacterium]
MTGPADLPPRVGPEEPLRARSLTRYFWRSRRRMWPGTIVAVLRTLAIAPCPLIFQRIIDRDVRAHDLRGVALHAGVFAALMAVHWILSIFGAHLIAKNLARLMVEMRARIFFRLQYLSFAHLDRQQTGRLLTKYAFDTQKIETVLFSVLNQLIPNVLYCASVFLVLSFLNWRLAAVLLVALPFWAVAKWRFFARLQDTNRRTRLAQETLTGTASEYISALKLVRSLGEEAQAERQLDRTSEEVAKQRVDQIWVSANFGTFAYVSTQLIALLIVGGGAVLAIRGGITLGTLLAFVAALPILLNPVQQFIGMSDAWFSAEESFASIKELVASPYVEQWHGTRRIARLTGAAAFEAVSFAYPQAEQPVIRNFSLEIRPGERLAFVGPSGAGKSTLVNLLLGLYAPTGGRILFDGAPQEDWDMRWVRRQFAVVMQENILFSGTIADNIRFARPEASEEEIRGAARMANAEEFILEMESGFQTRVGERGATLSGGQRQRIAIARAILRSPALLILDEATSALDYESERLIQEALRRLAAGRTVVTIAHRLSTIRDSDRIVVLSAGRIAEEGSYDALMRSGGAFAHLVAAQAGIPEQPPPRDPLSDGRPAPSLVSRPP